LYNWSIDYFIFYIFIDVLHFFGAALIHGIDFLNNRRLNNFLLHWRPFITNVIISRSHSIHQQVFSSRRKISYFLSDFSHCADSIYNRTYCTPNHSDNRKSPWGESSNRRNIFMNELPNSRVTKGFTNIMDFFAQPSLIKKIVAWVRHLFLNPV
jgi:hypothetical protein